MLINLINNIAFLIALAAAGQIVIARFYKKPLNRQILLGLLFGGVALLGMANPVNFSPGVIFDGRSIVLAVAGVVGGGIPAAIAAGIAAVYRFQLGGGGATVGIMVVLLSAVLGVLARQWWLRRSRPPRPIDYLALGVVVQLMQLAAFTQLPDRAGYTFIEQAWWVLLLFYPLATMLLCLIFRNHEQQLINQQALASARDAVIATERSSMQRFHAYFDHSVVGLAITSLEKGWIEVNDALCRTLGYTRDELTRMTWTELTYPEDLAPDLTQFNRMLAGEIDSYAMDKRFIHKDGHLVDTRLAVSHVRKPDGSLDYVVAMVEDISERKRTEEVLKRTVKDLRESQRIAHIGSWRLDVATNQVVWTEELYKMYGFDPSLPPPPYTEHMKLFTPESWVRLSTALAHTRESGIPYTLELETVRKDGKNGWLWVRGEVEVDSAGKTIGLWGAAQDITERKRAEKNLFELAERYRLANKATNDVIWDWDVIQDAQRWNEAGTAVFGWTEIVERPVSVHWWVERVHPNDQERVHESFFHVVNNSELVVWHDEYRFRKADGAYADVMDRGYVLRDEHGKAIQMIGAMQDITDRKRTEAELDQHRHHLEDLVALRTSELVLTKTQAEAASRAKSAFLANMSHELRTPINGIMGMLSLAKRRMVDPKGLDYLDKAKTAADHLLGVLNDILDLSKIEAERMVLEEAPLQLGEVLENLTSVLGHKAIEKGLKLETDLPDSLARMPLTGDSLRLGQILLNLAGNAIKFTERGRITLRVRLVAESLEAVQIRFDVIDTGIGIDPEAQLRLFNSFEQADNSITRKYGGTGLGLAISKRLAQLMGGEIGLDSMPGVGSTFWFSVRLVRRETGTVSPAPGFDKAEAETLLRRDYPGARILLAEDEPVNREIACFQLEDAGLAVDLAEDGQQALELARRNTYALILMDMQMPNLNGIDATRAIRADSLNRTTPILAMTANAFDEDRQACLDAGMNDHIAKPVDPEGLYETLLRWL